MPMIPPKLLKNVFYIYPTREAAEDGLSSGGTGFIVGYPVIEPNEVFTYLVTARHIVQGTESRWLRFNRSGGGVVIEELPADAWWISDDSDVALLRVWWISDPDVIEVVKIKFFLSQDVVDLHRIGPGDEAFMLGRFLPYDGGKDENVPVPRFGHVALFPERKMPMQYNGHKWEQDAYLVDFGVRKGFSGSPVFLYTLPGRLKIRDDGRAEQTNTALFAFLGLCSGAYPDISPVYKGSPDSREETDQFTEGYSGMAIVIPARKILELLERDDVKEERDEQMKVERELRG